ncbi:hypothetical protein PAXRUDRAFT_825386 [Paxillus rubicundulus Ve08.2h10]|uniref:Uncharacterized protein n=1 Tax=Paxillus rubicundulus Ve08.2h10 TaxID=930991 RepID=A0A0D0E6A6_9AGAM|nr:hypothetical protein PAXRUDRAFT_825386 [Paxillus rubicundulus Ve08.2h10]
MTVVALGEIGSDRDLPFVDDAARRQASHVLPIHCLPPIPTKRRGSLVNYDVRDMH